MKIYHQYHLVKFHTKNGYDTYHAVKDVTYENDRPVSIEEPRGFDYADGLEIAKSFPKLDAQDYGWEDKIQ